jgi:NAD(P)H-dependent FMN reductase
MNTLNKEKNMSADYLVISSSLNPSSNSRLLALKAYDLLSKHGATEIIDLRNYPLPLCDGESAYADPNVEKLTTKIASAKLILLAVPIYNYSFSAAAKNLLELTGQAWNEKTVGFLCAAGGKSSYMSIIGFANSLMFDFRCLINPRFVYADGTSFKNDVLYDAEITNRIEELVSSSVLLAQCVERHAKVKER